jgi:hypothetical protein
MFTQDDIAHEPERGDRRAGSWFGTVAKNITDLTELAEVVIPEFSDQLRFTKVRWMPRGDAALPNRGDEALVQFDNRGQPWIVAWWPF